MVRRNCASQIIPAIRYKQEIVAELSNSQPQCTTTALIVCKSIHFYDDTSIYHDI